MSGGKRKIGLVLGGGGAKGIAHIGVLQVLAENNIRRPDFVIGVSIGAIIGAMYCLDFSPAKIEKIAREFKGLRLEDLGYPRKSLLKNRRPGKQLREILGDKDLSETSLPFHVLATDLESGRERLFRKGNLVELLLASSAVPGIYPPVMIDNKYYVDGGLTNPTPVDAAERKGADAVIAVDLSMASKQRISEPTLLKTLLRSYEIERTNIVRSKLKDFNRGTIMINPKFSDISDHFKFENVDKFIQAGREAAEKQMDRIKGIC